MLLTVIFSLIPSKRIHSLPFIYTHSSSQLSDVNAEEDNTNVNDLKTPVYYSVFKFVLNYLPLKQAH